MKRFFLLAGVALGLISARAADPSVSGVAITQLSNRLVQVSYTLSDARAIVTPTFKLDGVAIAATNVVTLGGDVRRVVAPGARRFVWDPRADWKEAEVTTDRLTVELKVWKVSAPPPKMVIDLDPIIETSPSNVLYYASEEELPGGVGDARYRNGKLLMTLIPAAEVRWRFGNGTAAASKYVTLSHDFYISAFTFTRGQAQVALGEIGYVAGTDYGDRPLTPMETQYAKLRRGKVGDKETNVFGAEAIDAACYLKTLRDHTGLPLDLPSEFQWEFAMRAGVSEAYPTSMNSYGWWGKGCKGSWGTCSPDQSWPCSRDCPHPVGKRTPNAFGVYDILGNVREYTRTCWSESIDTTEERDPEGSIDARTAVTYRSDRHNSWKEGNAFYARTSIWHASENNNVGFRLVLPVEKED